MSLEVLSTPDPRIRMFRSPDVDCYVVVTERYVVVIDTFASVFEALQMIDSVSDTLLGRQLLIVNTHQHYDHAWGNGVCASYPAPILAHEASLAWLASAEGLAEKSTYQALAPKPLVPPNVTFTHLTLHALHSGDLTLELLPAPGHSPDQLVVWIPEIKTLLAADALEFPFPYVANPNDLASMLQTLDQLKNLNPLHVLPCHGGIHGADLIQKNLEYFASLVNQPSYESVLAALRLDPNSVPAMYREFHQLNLAALAQNRR
jgi:glyoxylase-like metal-dependent hydrolase (beta-lactamase superfamily II)